MAGKNQHVVPTPKGTWGVRGEGNSKMTKETPTQAQAIEIAREIAKNQGSEVVIHRKNGTIRDKDIMVKTHSLPRTRSTNYQSSKT